ncbi:MAG: hypothetical protein ACKOFK_01645 [Betaproteobacteria bacterium]
MGTHTPRQPGRAPGHAPLPETAHSLARRQWLRRSGVITLGAAAAACGLVGACAQRDAAPDAAFTRLDGSTGRMPLPQRPA